MILRHGEPLGAAIMDVGAQLRNAASPPVVERESEQVAQEQLDLDRRIAEGFEQWGAAHEAANARRATPAKQGKRK